VSGSAARVRAGVASAAAGDNIRDRLARYRGIAVYRRLGVPRSVVFHAELPRNATGKVLKRMLRQAGPRQAGPLAD
jgi:acyl-coenzyme A synthetase/AMP-(fatty) acid ligase